MFPDGKAAIAVECFAGAEGAREAALARQGELRDAGNPAHLTAHDLTMGPTGAPIPLHGKVSLFDRATVLLRDPEVQHLLLVIETDEVLQTGPAGRGHHESGDPVRPAPASRRPWRGAARDGCRPA